MRNSRAIEDPDHMIRFGATRGGGHTGTPHKTYNVSKKSKSKPGVVTLPVPSAFLNHLSRAGMNPQMSVRSSRARSAPIFTCRRYSMLSLFLLPPTPASAVLSTKYIIIMSYFQPVDTLCRCGCLTTTISFLSFRVTGFRDARLRPGRKEEGVGTVKTTRRYSHIHICFDRH